MAECECISGCPFFNGRMAQTMGTVVESMKRRYCLGDQTNCARHMVKRTLGKEHVPPDMIPNQIEIAQQMIEAAGLTVK